MDKNEDAAKAASDSSAVTGEPDVLKNEIVHVTSRNRIQFQKALLLSQNASLNICCTEQKVARKRATSKEVEGFFCFFIWWT